MSSITMSMSGLAITFRASSTTCTPSPTTALARATSRSATMVISMPRPARRRISSWLRCNTLKVPVPTVPMPKRPTLIGLKFVALIVGFIVAGVLLIKDQKSDSAVTPDFKKAGNAPNGFAQVIFMWQKDNAEMIWRSPVKTSALHQHDARFFEQLQKKLPVVGNGINLGVEPWKHIQRRTCLLY